MIPLISLIPNDVAMFSRKLILAGFDEVYPLWAISTRRTGGLEWDMILVGQVCSAEYSTNMRAE